MNQFLMLVFSTFIFQLAMAQTPVDPKDVNYLKQTGQMFTVKIVPGDKESSFYILGKEAAKIKIDKLRVEATLFMGETPKKITLLKKNDHFVTSTPLKGDSIHLKLQDEKPTQTEEIRIKLKP